MSFGPFPVINLRSWFTALRLWNCVRDDYPRAIGPLDLSGVCSNVWLSAKGFKATGQWLFRCIFFGVMYVVMHVVEGEYLDCFFWLHLGFLTLFFWVASSSLGYQGGGDESASIPQSFCFSLILCSVFWIYQIWKKVSCAYDPSPFSLPLEVWVRCRGYAQTLIKQTVCDFLHMGSHTCKHGFGQSRHYSTTLDSCPVPLLRFATFQVTTTLTSSISVVDSLMFSRLFLFWQLISLLPWPEGEGSILWVLFNKCPLSCSVF